MFFLPSGNFSGNIFPKNIYLTGARTGHIAFTGGGRLAEWRGLQDYRMYSINISQAWLILEEDLLDQTSTFAAGHSAGPKAKSLGLGHKYSPHWLDRLPK